MMKTAKEMFEELGYRKSKHLTPPSVGWENKEWETAISFLGNKDKGYRIHVYALGNTYQDSGMITVDEFKAIHQQMKELGWLNE